VIAPGWIASSSNTSVPMHMQMPPMDAVVSSAAAMAEISRRSVVS
jgi:hypothetical protein